MDTQALIDSTSEQLFPSSPDKAKARHAGFAVDGSAV